MVKALGQATTAILTVLKPETATKVLVPAKSPNQPQVAGKPAGLPLDRRNITYKQRAKELKIKTLAELDKDEFVDKYPYDEKKGGGHENKGVVLQSE